MKIYIPSPEFLGDPEALSMLQAFYSRSSEGIEERLEKLGGNMTTVKKALNRHYVNFGHASIADCGDVTVFVEGVSILAAKALQENPLYNGQECSTRYIDIGDGLYSPSATDKRWLDMYKRVKDLVLEGVRNEHPIEKDQSQTLWNNATAARAFDIARGWLPCSLLTNLSIKLSIRKFNDFTTQLMAHPLPEVHNIAVALRTQLLDRFPSGIKPMGGRDVEVVEWIRNQGLDYWYSSDSTLPYIKPGGRVSIHVDALGQPSGEALRMLANRPRYAEVPHWLEADMQFTIRGAIDYGTWRDLQRHRRNVGRPPLPRTSEFHPWYLEQFDRYVLDKNMQDIVTQTQNMTQQLRPAETQEEEVLLAYKLPLGTVVPFEYTMGLAQAVYFAELRSGNTVHAILRPVAQKLAWTLEDLGIPIYYDLGPARFDLRRGAQTIVERG